MAKKNIVELMAEEQELLVSLTRSGKTAARKLQHAHVLLKANSASGEPAWTDQKIAETFSLSTRSVERVRERFVKEGLQAALERRQAKRTKPRKLDGEQEAQLIAIACSNPPAGRTRWTLRLLAEQLVVLQIVDSIHHETVNQTLKKMKLSLG